LRSGEQGTSNPEARTNLSKQIQLLRAELLLPDNPPTGFEMQELDEGIAGQETYISKLQSLIDTAWKKELETEHGYNDWKYITATAITRVGVVLIIVFLVQILLGLYRYNTRLAAYYNARRDLLTLWNGDPKTLTMLDKVLAPPKIEFGREPKHPLEDVLKAVGEKARSSSIRGTTTSD
jgi:hypothetical protein